MSDDWDHKSQTIYYKGKEYEVFSRGALAKALNRQHVTIRQMTNQGVLCNPRYQNSRGQWIYSRAQIEALIKLADEEEVLDPRFRRTFTERFITEANKICKWPLS